MSDARNRVAAAMAREPELRSAPRSPYQSYIDMMTDWIYGPNATMRDREAAEKWTGASNPLNVPLQALHGAETMYGGARDRDPYAMAAGAIELGGAGFGAYGMRQAMRGKQGVAYAIAKGQQQNARTARANQAAANQQLIRNQNREFHEQYANMPEIWRQEEIARRVAEAARMRQQRAMEADVEIGPPGSFQGERPGVGWWNDVNTNMPQTGFSRNVPPNIGNPKYPLSEYYHPAERMESPRSMYGYEADPSSIPGNPDFFAPPGTRIGSLSAEIDPAAPSQPLELPQMRERPANAPEPAAPQPEQASQSATQSPAPDANPMPPEPSSPPPDPGDMSGSQPDGGSGAKPKRPRKPVDPNSPKGLTQAQKDSIKKKFYAEFERSGDKKDISAESLGLSYKGKTPEQLEEYVGFIHELIDEMPKGTRGRDAVEFLKKLRDRMRFAVPAAVGGAAASQTEQGRGRDAVARAMAAGA